MAERRYQSVKHVWAVESGLTGRLPDAPSAVRGRSAFFRKSQAALAQLVEHIIRNDGVACSSHASGTTSLILTHEPIARTRLRGAGSARPRPCRPSEHA